MLNSNCISGSGCTKGAQAAQVKAWWPEVRLCSLDVDEDARKEASSGSTCGSGSY